MADIVKEAVKYYTDKLIRQYSQQPNARATMDAYNEFFLKILPIVNFFENFLNIDEAQYDWQLDTIGKIVGITRERSEGATNINKTGFFVLGNPPINKDNNGYFINDNNAFLFNQLPFFDLPNDDKGSVAITNNEFKSLIKFKIILNNTKFFGRELEEKIFNQFGNDIRVKTTYNEDMIFLVNINFGRMFRYAKQQNLLPVPQNVSPKYAIIFNSTPFFCFFENVNFSLNNIQINDVFTGIGDTQPVSGFFNSEFALPL